jgi:hypothetical protein
MRLAPAAEDTMSNGAAATAAAAVAQAIKASGVIVRMEPDEFLNLLSKHRDALVVHAVGGVFSTNYQYLFGCKGLAFYTKSSDALPLPTGVEVVAARSIWIPS